MENGAVCSLYITWTSVTEDAHAGLLKQPLGKIAMKYEISYNGMSRLASCANAM